ncbi:MAG TPA: Calx-beta domain-containing protein [Candidatus Polarisedimenticolia bacterium]|nr:Calx-beta domain-containing protein [Candidatus Polarisedimenticolia bacterium]
MRPVRDAVRVLLVTVLLGQGATAQSRQLTFEERVRAQEAIERLNYSHQIGASLPFEEAIPRSLLEKKVTTYLKQSAALEMFWKSPVSSEQLRRELERMAANSRMPERLQQLYAVLGNDPFLIEETVARPALVDRLTRSFFAMDAGIHAEERAQAEALQDDLLHGRLDPMSDSPARSVLEVSHGHAGAPESGRLELTPEGFEKFKSQLPRNVGDIGRVEDTRESFLIRVPLDKSSDSAKVATFTVAKLGWDEWWSSVEDRLDASSVEAVAAQTERLPETAPAQLESAASSCIPDDTWDNGALEELPDGRSGHTAVWTGSVMIVWGGQYPLNILTNVNTGGRYDPATDTWTPVSPIKAPANRYGHTAIWTGDRMVVWGGFEVGNGPTNTGGRYDPATDTWATVSTTNAPPARRAHTAVWTGGVMIVWGGLDDDLVASTTGGRYNPATNSWTPVSTLNAPSAIGHTAVWTGTQMIVWGGTASPVGGRYNLQTDTWTPTTSDVSALSNRTSHSAVWTGSRMVVWGGNGDDITDTGGLYDPVADSWTPTNTLNEPLLRYGHTAEWTGSEMLVWGGFASGTGFLNTGGRFNPVTNTWSALSSSNAPLGRVGHTAVWTGSRMIVWGGNDSQGYFQTGGRYNPASNSWTPTSTADALPIRNSHTAIWTGTKMIVWGGLDVSVPLKTGGWFDPVTAQWTPLSTTNAPAARYAHTAVWTGREMIVWGGQSSASTVLGTGGRYNPLTDTWTTTSTTGAPQARAFHTAAWTGREMVVWGGSVLPLAYPSSGARYDPVKDQWTPTSQTNAPAGRADHTAVWSGSVMIVWGGRNSNGALQTGARYNPSLDLWTATSMAGAPPASYEHTAIWTGSKMIVWGGSNNPATAFNTGGRYDPLTDSWQLTSTTNAPTGRADHTALWTGSVMLVWGGFDGAANTNTGGRYDPGTDTWSATSILGAPGARAHHSAIWTGSTMIVWGGGPSDESGGAAYALGQGADNDGDGSSECAGDCNDADASIHPGAEEPCDGLDHNCDGVVQSCASSDLAIYLAGSPNPVGVGATLTDTLTVLNAGPGTANSIVVTETVPPGAVFLCASGTGACGLANGWTCGQSAGGVTCTRPTLALGAAPNIIIQMTAPAAGPLVSTATVSASEFDPVAGNNLDTESTALLVDVLQFSAPQYQVVEGISSATIMVQRLNTTQSTVGVSYSTSNGSATAGSDYTTASGTLTFGPGIASQTFTVPILNDHLPESDETVNLSLSAPTGGASLGSPSAAVLTIRDVVKVQFSAATYSVSEASATATVTVTRTGGSAGTVTVNYAVSNGSAQAGADFTAVSGTLSFGAGVLSKTFTVPILNDAVDEFDETVSLTLSNPTGAAMLGSPAAAVLTIGDNDVGGVLKFSAATYTVSEATASVTITVTRSGGAASGVTVDYSTSGGTATAGSDYTLANGTLTFGAGVTSKTFTVPILNDTRDEANETVSLTLSNSAGGATLGTPNPSTLTITDNDVGGTLKLSAATYSAGEAGGNATITVTRSGGAASGVTVHYETGNGTATAGSDYSSTSGNLTFAAGETTKTFAVPILNDGLGEGNETVNLTLSNPTGGATLATPNAAVLTIVDDEVVLQFSASSYSVTENTTNASITVARSGPTTSAVSVGYSMSSGTATSGVDYTAVSGTVSLGVGVTSKTFTVPILGDTLDEADETVNLTLSGPTGGALLGPRSAAVLTITDNDVGGALKFSVAAYTVSEATATATVTVTRSGGTASGVTVDYATSNGTGTVGSDYTAAAGTLSFGSGVTSKTFTVPILPDTLDEANETILLTLSNPTGGATLTTPNPATLTITDNDVGGALKFSAATYNVGEAGGSATITVTRSGGTASGVTVEYGTSDGTATAGSDYSHTEGTLAFGAGELSKTFTVPVLNDGLGEGNETVNLALSDPTGGATLATPNAAALTIADDEVVLQFSAATYSVTEGAVNATITVVRSGPTAAAIGVNYSVSDGSATAGADYKTVSGTVSLGAGISSKTFVVPILSDTLDEANETVNLALSGPTGGALLGPRSAAVLTITDNDVGGALKFSAATYSVGEGSASVTITVSRTGGTASGVTVDYTTGGGTATAGVDYTGSSGTLIFASGQTSRTFTVIILPDTLDEPNETVSLTLSNPTGGATLATPNPALLTITDND